ncbi:AcvB/VirJ family lysyl-phosphatidylglycerol hydrolase [Pseudoxanthomonas sp. X-1]|uniref:virulence factor family protein n=1 Tax=Pseudoxanthomonas sp. X-1 TaxID=2571115 RepID=UPI00110AB537|nr:AcvB/VirJ family lysyl-phosphatidylglycerol hydrolase [Pseudoxanthomonas sp. X-1]TMN19928.1 virulence factor family protein [Pseudoxanthomonas sp. X-1]UAY75887.1 virulence factor family protein [Pseudoxanthomonas sp. X-1]
MIRLASCLLLLACALPVAAQQSRPAPERISHGNFRDVALYRPVGPLKQVVLMLSGDGGWNATMDADAQALAANGTFVAGIDTPQMRRQFTGDGKGCVFPDGDLENLSHYLQGYAQLPGYRAPLLIGEGSGAAIAYAMVAAGDAGIFAGALTLDFTPALDLGRVPCEGKGNIFDALPTRGATTTLVPARQKLDVPWLTLDTDGPKKGFDAKPFAAQVKGSSFVQLATGGDQAAVRRAALTTAAHMLAREQVATLPPPPPQDLSGLPLNEVPATGGARGDTYAILLSGDGGWAGLDQEVAKALAAKGIPVVGFDSLRYFWKKRTPQGLASDLDRIIRYYSAHWGKARVMLIGYSQGADVLPFAVNRLAPDTRAQLLQAVYLALSNNAAFEFHVTNWMSDDVADAIPTMPEILRLKAAQNFCVYGEGDDEQVCSKIPPGHLRVQALTGGHHFDGDYAHLADIILTAASAAEDKR